MTGAECGRREALLTNKAYRHVLPWNFRDYGRAL
jgi:hypothetical protein